MILAWDMVPLVFLTQEFQMNMTSPGLTCDLFAEMVTLGTSADMPTQEHFMMRDCERASEGSPCQHRFTCVCDTPACRVYLLILDLPPVEPSWEICDISFEWS